MTFDKSLLTSYWTEVTFKTAGSNKSQDNVVTS